MFFALAVVALMGKMLLGPTGFVFNFKPRQTRLECMNLSNTTLFDGKDMYRIYYIQKNYMFRHLTMAIFRLRMKKLSKQLHSNYVGCIHNPSIAERSVLITQYCAGDKI